MEVFALEMAVRETGAAQMQQSLAKVRTEAQKTAQATGVAAQQMTATTIATNKAATAATKGSLAMAGMARNMIASGNAASLMSGGIVEAGSQVATMFGPAGILVAAVGFFATTFVSSMKQVREEVRRTLAEIDADTRRMGALLGDIARIQTAEGARQARTAIRSGTGRGVSGARATAEDIRALGIDAIERELRGMQRAIENARTRARNLAITPDARDEARAQVTELTAAVQRYTTVLRELQTLESAVSVRERELLGIQRQRLVESNAEIRAMTERTAAIWREAAAIENRENIKALGPAGLPRGFSGAVRPLFSPEQIAEATRIDEIRTTLAEGVADAIATGFTAGITQAIASGSIGAGFQALAGTLLAGLGNAMVQFGTAALFTAKLMEAIKASLASFLPGGAIVASVAMIAAGAALSGVAQRAFGGMGGRGLGGGGTTAGAPPQAPAFTPQLQFGGTSANVAAGLSPAMFTNFTVIGPNDPTAQRTIEELLRKAQTRGTL